MVYQAFNASYHTEINIYQSGVLVQFSDQANYSRGINPEVI
jgi:hypothetical protein